MRLLFAIYVSIHEASYDIKTQLLEKDCSSLDGKKIRLRFSFFLKPIDKLLFALSIKPKLSSDFFAISSPEPPKPISFFNFLPINSYPPTPHSTDLSRV
jgi:hypothetical protein